METHVMINSKDYIISKFKFGKQQAYAKAIGKLFSGIKYDLTNNTFANFDLGSLISTSPEISIELLSIALGIPTEEVEQFDTDEAENALSKILELNPVNEVLKKSMTLLGNSLSA